MAGRVFAKSSPKDVFEVLFVNGGTLMKMDFTLHRPIIYLVTLQGGPN